jgi:uncharacterized membrane protein YeiB
LPEKLVHQRFLSTFPLLFGIGFASPIPVLQRVWSELWLRGMRQGPPEWLWRWATWARPPMRIMRDGSRG